MKSNLITRFIPQKLFRIIWDSGSSGFSILKCPSVIPKECFSITDRRVDMIVGARDKRKFQLFECCVWEENLPNEPLVATHSLGEIFWVMREVDNSFHHMCAMHTVARASGNFALEILQLVADQHKISTEECVDCRVHATHYA